MNYSEQIFKMLGISPNEEFGLYSNGRLQGVYKFNTNLYRYNKHADESFSMCANERDFANILNGNLKIVKIPKPTSKDKIAIEYATLCGCKWLAKDKSGAFYGFENKPTKINNCWVDKCIEDVRIYYPISFLSWEDEEPYYIG